MKDYLSNLLILKNKSCIIETNFLGGFVMLKYKIQKVNNNEYREVSKELSLNVNEYCKNPKLLTFNVTGEENPLCMNFYVFYQSLIDQIAQGLIESIEYDQGLFLVTMRDGTTIKNYLYDFHWEQFANRMQSEALGDLKSMIMEVVSFYNDNPYRESLNDAKYLRMIYDILDADRPQRITNENDVMKILTTYNKYKSIILELLLSRVVFYDDKDRIIEYGKVMRARNLKAIKPDVLKQMEFAILLFAGINNKAEEYKAYLEKTHMPRRHVFLQAFDDEGNLVGLFDATAPVSAFARRKEFAKEKLDDLKTHIANGFTKVGEKLQGHGRSK